MSRDPFQVLGVSKNSSVNDIKKSYLNLAQKWHPGMKEYKI